MPAGRTANFRGITSFHRSLCVHQYVTRCDQFDVSRSPFCPRHDYRDVTSTVPILSASRYQLNMQPEDHSPNAVNAACDSEPCGCTPSSWSLTSLMLWYHCCAASSSRGPSVTLCSLLANPQITTSSYCHLSPFSSIISTDIVENSLSLLSNKGPCINFDPCIQL